VICEAISPISSPVEDADGVLYVVTQNGDVMRVSKSGQASVDFNIPGQLSGIAIDKTGKNVFIADLADQAIIGRSGDDRNIEVGTVISEYKGASLLGPHSLVIAHISNRIYFTDAGPLGETSLENPKGSLFEIDLGEMLIQALTLHSLAYPTGLALSLDEKNLYVCETCSNRLVRFIVAEKESRKQNVFHQFEGRFGPTAVTIANSGNIYVGRFDFATNSSEGIITVLNRDGERIDKIIIPGAPEISGLCFSRIKPHILYVTDNSKTPVCLRVAIQGEIEEGDKEKSETPFK